ncbi:DUF1254 domain-containing protein [Cupriavidus basilensis]
MARRLQTRRRARRKGESSVSQSETRSIAKDAYIYGFPIVEAYKTLYAQAVDKGGPNYKAPFNQIGNTANVFTPKDTAIITPNSDTPYSFVWMDLRAEPVVLTLPPIEAQRYYSVQLVDLYTHNFAYLGTRATAKQGRQLHHRRPGMDRRNPSQYQWRDPHRVEHRLCALSDPAP